MLSINLRRATCSGLLTATLASCVLACSGETSATSKGSADSDVSACTTNFADTDPAHFECGDSRCTWRTECGGNGVAPGTPLAGGGDGDGDAPACREVVGMGTPTMSDVDIVFAIDNSGSMDAEIAAVESNLNAFSTSLAGLGINYRIVMISCKNASGCNYQIDIPTPLGGDGSRYKFIDEDVDSHDALLDMYNRLWDTTKGPTYGSFLRSAASLHFIAITDDDSSMTAANFKSKMDGKLGKPYKVHAVASPYVADTEDHRCEWNNDDDHAAAWGEEYEKIVASTGGTFHSICTDDWTTLFAQLKGAIDDDAPVPCTYSVPAPPSGSVIDFDKINVEVRASGQPNQSIPHRASDAACQDGGWYYVPDTGNQQIRMCDSTCTSVRATTGATIHLDFGCLPIVG